MKRLPFIASLLVLSCGPMAWAQTDTLPERLGQGIRSPEGLRQLIERRDPRFVIVDVRPPAEYDAGHIPTAINIPGGITADIKTPPTKDKYLVLYCHGGMKSPAAGDRMRADGYPHVLVWGGIMSWPYERETATK